MARKPSFDYVAEHIPLEEQTDEDRRLQQRAAAILFGLPLLGELARPAAPVSAKRVTPAKETTPCPKHS